MKTLALIATLPFLTPAQNDDLKQLASRSDKHVSVRIDGLNVSESFIPLNLYGSKTGERYYFNGWVNRSESLYFSGDERGLWGGDVNVSLFKSGDRVQVNGTINGRSAFFSLSKWGDGWTLHSPMGTSLNLYKSGSAYMLSGYIDEKQHSPGKLAGVIGAVVAIVSGAK